MECGTSSEEAIMRQQQNNRNKSKPCSSGMPSSVYRERYTSLIAPSLLSRLIGRGAVVRTTATAADRGGGRDSLYAQRHQRSQHLREKGGDVGAGGAGDGGLRQCSAWPGQCKLKHYYHIDRWRAIQTASTIHCFWGAEYCEPVWYFVNGRASGTKNI